MAGPQSLQSLVHVEEGVTGCKTARGQCQLPPRPRCTKNPPQGPSASPNHQNHRAWGFVGSPGATFGPSSHCGRVSYSRVHGQGGCLEAERQPHPPSSAETRFSHPDQTQGTSHHSLAPWGPSKVGLVAAGSAEGPEWVRKTWLSSALPAQTSTGGAVVRRPGLMPSSTLVTLNLSLFFWPWAPPGVALKGLKR